MKQEIEYFEKGVYKIHINDAKLKEKLAKWQDLRRLNIHNVKGIISWDYVFPSKLHDRVAQLAGLPLKAKNKNRVLAGKQSAVGTGKNRYDFTKVNFSQMTSNASKIGEVCKGMANG